MTVIVEGADELGASLAEAARALNDSAPNTATAEAVKEAARPPVVTGFLASSATIRSTSDGAELAWTAPYARIIDQGAPSRNIRPRYFVQGAIDSANWTEPWEQHLGDTLDNVKGI